MNYTSIKQYLHKWPVGIVEHIESSAAKLSSFINSSTPEALIDFTEEVKDLYAFLRSNNIQWDKAEINSLVRQALPELSQLTYSDYLHANVIPDELYQHELILLCVEYQIPISVLQTDCGELITDMSLLFARAKLASVLLEVHYGKTITENLDNIPSYLHYDVNQHIEQYANVHHHPAALMLLRAQKETLSFSTFQEIMTNIDTTSSLTDEQIDIANDMMTLATTMDDIPEVVAKVIGSMAINGHLFAQMWLGRALEINSTPTQANDVYWDTESYSDRYYKAMQLMRA